MTRAIVWFRRDLSLDDNLAWATATVDHAEVLPIYVFDRRLLDVAGPYRRRQLIASVAALADELRMLGGSLTVTTSDPVEAVARLAREHRVDAVVWNNDVTGSAGADDAVHRRLSQSGIAVERSWSTLVHPPGTVLTSAGSVPRVFGRFYERWSAAPLPEPARAGRGATSSRSPATHCHRSTGPHRSRPGAKPLRAGSPRSSNGSTAMTPNATFPAATPHRTSRPTCASAPSRPGRWCARSEARHPDAKRSPVNWPGETGTRTSSPSAPTSSTTRSSRSTTQLRGVPTRPRCRPGNKAAPATRSSTPACANSATTGWMPNRLRLITASFLVKDLLADWRIGERHFRHLLVDGDIPQNAGNWQWVAGTGPDAAPYFRVLNPLTQARRFDPDGDYVRRFVPELAALPGASIHAPTELGPLELASAGVVLGDTYPYPIVDHAPARERAIAAYATAKTGKAGSQ